MLHVNDGPLPASLTAPLMPSDPSEPTPVLRARLASQGYLFLKHLLPRDAVLAARGEYFKMLAPSGLLKPGTRVEDGVFDGMRRAGEFPGIGAGSVGGNGRPGEGGGEDEGDGEDEGNGHLDGEGKSNVHSDGEGKSSGEGKSNGEVESNEKNEMNGGNEDNRETLPLTSHQRTTLFVDLALQAHSAAWYEHLASLPQLREAVAQLTGWGADTLALKRSLLRNNTPGNRAIGVHYDQIFLRHGEPSAVTAWVPMGDVAVEGGGIIYLEDSDELGQQIEAAFAAKAAATGLSDTERLSAFNANMMSTGFLADGPVAFARQHGRRWLVAAYEAGDVVLHSAHMIHASTINHDAHNRIRVGTDLRFVNSARKWDTRWASTFRFDDGV